MRLGLIGTGRWGKHLARNFYETGVLKVLCDLFPTFLYPDIPSCTDASTLFLDERISQIAIATPPDTHYALTKKALLAGKDVFVEKPLCFFVDEAKELIELAHQNQLILMVGHLLHYHPCIVVLKKIIQSGQLGNIMSLQTIRSSPQRSNTTALWDLGPHDVSLILSLFGCSQSDLMCEGTEDDCKLTVTLPNSLQAQAFFSIGKERKEQKLSIVGSQATAIFTSNELLTLIPGGSFYSNKEPLREECDHFLDCCRSRTTPLTDGEEALRVINVLQKAEGKMRLIAK